MKLKIRRILNKEVDGKFYWKWYIDVPSNYIKEHRLKVGDILEIKQQKVGSVE